jgi:uncharacterized CHY-type Zn-finger protein
MDIIRFYEDYHIEIADSGHKHARPGWVNIECPFCTGNPGFHLGFDLIKNYYKCWRCGFHPTGKVIQKLIDVNAHEAYQIIKAYGGQSVEQKTIIKVRRKKLKYPFGTDGLKKNHKRYLIKRKFDPDKLEREWELLGTGPVALLDDIDYSHRILAPINYQNAIVSFQTRDITNKAKSKYMACPKCREVIEHKLILYGLDKCKSKTVILVEGITDVWRLGPGAVACFGIGWKREQIKLLAETFDRIIILFDDEPQALASAKQAKAELIFRGKQVVVKTITGDPGDMDQDDADHFMKNEGL